MKKLMLFGLLVYATSCSNPEDNATGNADSTRFNNTEETNLNTPVGPADPNSQSDAEKPDSSAAPALDKKNATSDTAGTNRAY